MIDDARQVGGNVVLTLSADTQVVLENMKLAQLDMSDFLF